VRPTVALAIAAFLASGSALATEPDVVAPEPAAEKDDRLGWAVPDHVRLQTGGWIGAFTVGIGYSLFGDHLAIDAFYGYVPPLDGAPRRHIGTGGMYIRPLRVGLGGDVFIVPFYLGAGVMVASGADVFVHQPKELPSGYYAPTAVHWFAAFGVEIGIGAGRGAAIRRHALYAEEVTIDQYFDALVQNRDLRLVDAFSTALGYRASF
jgi:hypothetical protein